MEGLDNKNIEGKIEFVLVVHMGVTHLPTMRNGLQETNNQFSSGNSYKKQPQVRATPLPVASQS